MTKKSTSTRRESGTIAKLAKGLGYTTRHVNTLLGKGMPDTLTAAQEWLTARESGDSVTELRRQRIGLISEQRRRAKIDADEREGLLISKEIVADQHRRIALAVQVHLRRIENEIPQICLGLPLERSRPLVKDFIRKTQLQVAQNHPDFWPAALPPGWEI